MGLTVAMDNGPAGDRRSAMPWVPRIVLALVLLALVGAGVRFGVPLVRADRDTSLGNAYREVLEWDRALELYRSAIAADPGFPEPHARTGDIYRAQSALAAAPEDEAERLQLAQQAIAAYSQSLALNPYQSDVMLRLASAFELAGDNVSALRTYDRALAVDPNNAFNYLRLGVFYRRMGEMERATEAFETSSELGSRDQIAVVNIEDIRRRR
jgi:tetratricopeptide (TPR) repeat protein